MASSLCWCVQPHYFHTFCWTDKRTNISVPSLRQSPGWHFVTRCSLWFSSVEAFSCCCCSSSCFPNKSSSLLASAPNSEAISATRISLMASSWSSIFRVHLWMPTKVCLIFILLPTTAHNCRNPMPRRCELLLLWQQNRSKGTMWKLYKISAIRGFLRRF